jgi:lipoprotein-anchoring transpeptidase ErfK/SrfK
VRGAAAAGLLALLVAPGSALAQAPAIAAPSRAHGSTVARIVAPSLARRTPSSTRHARPLRTSTAWSAQPQSLLVLGSTTRRGVDWVEVLLPSRPNGSTGWVPRDHVVLTRTTYWIDVRTAARRVTIHHNGRPERRFRAVVGAPATPTPRGLAAIYERNRQADPGGFVGPWALALTSLSDVLEDYGGGPGRIAIHGRAGASLLDPLGSARSHGCIRIDDDAVSWMAGHIPAGTPVRLR